jgi:3-methyladenine DNA glycosylase AlkD
MKSSEIIAQLKSQVNPKNIAGMARFGIIGKNVLGISIPYLRNLAKNIKKENIDNHQLAGELWSSEIHEGRILASFIDKAEEVTEDQMESWVKDFDSWDLCDQVTTGLFDKTTFAYKKAFEWSKRPEEFVKRAGFTLMAGLAVHDKKASDNTMIDFFEPIICESTDDRNFVKKAVNWALRNIGKRNQTLRNQAIITAEKILKLNNKTAKWVAGDALREFAKVKIRKP